MVTILTKGEIEKLLRPYESVLYVTVGGIVKSKGFGRKKGGGNIIVTNRRLIIAEAKGLFRRKVHVHLEIPLASIEKVELKGIVRKTLHIKTHAEEYEIRAREIEKLYEILRESIRKRIYPFLREVFHGKSPSTQRG